MFFKFSPCPLAFAIPNRYAQTHGSTNWQTKGRTADVEFFFGGRGMSRYSYEGHNEIYVLFLGSLEALEDHGWRMIEMLPVAQKHRHEFGTSS